MTPVVIAALVAISVVGSDAAALRQRMEEERNPRRIKLSDYMPKANGMFTGLAATRDMAAAAGPAAGPAPGPAPGPAIQAPAPAVVIKTMDPPPQKVVDNPIAKIVKKDKVIDPGASTTAGVELVPVTAAPGSTTAEALIPKTTALPMLVPVLGEQKWKFVGGSTGVQETKADNSEWSTVTEAPEALAAASPGPSPAASPCDGLFGLAGSAGEPENFVECKELRTSPTAVPGDLGDLLGCECGAWSATCPFQKCAMQQAWEESCLDPQAESLGFVALSHSRQKLPESSLPWPMTRFSEGNPSSVSLCMYWLPEPKPAPLAPAPALAASPGPGPAPGPAAPAPGPAPPPAPLSAPAPAPAPVAGPAPGPAPLAVKIEDSVRYAMEHPHVPMPAPAPAPMKAPPAPAPAVLAAAPSLSPAPAPAPLALPPKPEGAAP